MAGVKTLLEIRSLRRLSDFLLEKTSQTDLQNVSGDEPSLPRVAYETDQLDQCEAFLSVHVKQCFKAADQ